MQQAVALSVIAIATVLVGAALSAASTFFAPVVMALVSGVVLAPVTDFLVRHGLSRTFAALLALIVTLSVVAALALTLQPVVNRLITQIPVVLSDIEATLRDWRYTLHNLGQMSENIADTRSIQSGPDEGGNPAPAEGDMPTVKDALLLAPSLAAQAILFAGTLFFFLVTRQDVYAWLLPRIGRIDAQALTGAERDVSHYFLTITLINASLGIAVAVVLSLIGLPGAMQWGLLAFFFNFIVYLGPAIFGISLLIAGIAAFDGVRSIVPAIAYLALNFSEGQFITPALVGREMRINPLLVFLSVTFGLWLWGAVGGIVAIPLVVFGRALMDALDQPE